jgi:tellurite resistance protein
MTEGPARFRPKRYPPPEFPPVRKPTFSRTPPAIFPVLLGLLGLTTALRVGLPVAGVPTAVGDLATGLVLPIWAFAAIAYLAKIIIRFSVITDDLKVMPSRSGLAAATLGGMLAAGLLVPFSLPFAKGLLALSLVAHGIVVALTVRTLVSLPAEGRIINPGWHMTFVGFIVGAAPAWAMGYRGLAEGILLAMLPVAVVIWGASLVQLVGRIPPAPLRPMLAIHLAPASLFAIAATLTGQQLLATVMLAVVLAILLALLARLRWLTEAGFSPIWGAFTFPLTAASTALLLQGGGLQWIGLVLLAIALAAVPWIAWKVLSLWPGGRLAQKTNAAQA